MEITFCHSIFSTCNLTTPTILCSPLCSVNRGPGHWRTDCWSHKRKTQVHLRTHSELLHLALQMQSFYSSQNSGFNGNRLQRSLSSSVPKQTRHHDAIIVPTTSALRILMSYIRLRFDSREVAYMSAQFCWRICILLFTNNATAYPSGQAV